MDDEHQDRRRERCSPHAGRHDADDNDDLAPPLSACAGSTPVPFGLPIAGRSVRIGLWTVKGMEVDEGPPFYELS